MVRNGSVLLLLVVASVSHAEPPPSPSSGGVTSFGRAIQSEVARFAEAEAAATHPPPLSPAAVRRRSWCGRHPVWTAAIAGAASGFLVGYLPGDDAVFDDFTAGFNGTVVGAIGAGGAASVVAIVPALRRPLPGR